MKITRANVEEYAKVHGLEPVQIDGIPEGFSFRSAGIQIGPKHYPGQWIAFVPLVEWEHGKISENSEEDLLTTYKRIKKNGK